MLLLLQQLLQPQRRRLSMAQQVQQRQVQMHSRLAAALLQALLSVQLAQELQLCRVQQAHPLQVQMHVNLAASH
jgi:hypothetical protein